MVATAGRAPRLPAPSCTSPPCTPRRRAPRAEHCPEGPPVRASSSPGDVFRVDPRGLAGEVDPGMPPYGPFGGRYGMYFSPAPPGERVPEHEVVDPGDTVTRWGAPGRSRGRRVPRGVVPVYRRPRRTPREYPPAAPQAGRGVRGTGGRRPRYAMGRGSSCRAPPPRGAGGRGTRPWLPLLAPGAYAATSPGVRRGRRDEQLRSRTGDAATGTAMGHRYRRRTHTSTGRTARVASAHRQHRGVPRRGVPVRGARARGTPPVLEGRPGHVPGVPGSSPRSTTRCCRRARHGGRGEQRQSRQRSPPGGALSPGPWIQNGRPLDPGRPSPGRTWMLKPVSPGSAFRSSGAYAGYVLHANGSPNRFGWRGRGSARGSVRRRPPAGAGGARTRSGTPPDTHGRGSCTAYGRPDVGPGDPGDQEPVLADRGGRAAGRPGRPRPWGPALVAGPGRRTARVGPGGVEPGA